MNDKQVYCDALIERLDHALHCPDDADFFQLLTDCRAALSRKYVPMTDESVDEILSEIDNIARNVCHYEYGLPMYNCAERQLMREVIRRAGLEVQKGSEG